tara:strand:+ start:22170 stop:22460 length:291 start_codon:yes stop_codon:yes gene_type:complete
VDIKKPKNDKSPLEAILITCLDVYFEQLGNQKPHAVLDMVTEVFEKPTIEYALKKTSGNLTKASDILGITRSTLRKKMTKYSLAQIHCAKTNAYRK